MVTFPRFLGFLQSFTRGATLCLAIVTGLASVAPAASATSLEEALGQCADKPNPRLKYECEKEIKSTFAVTKLKNESTKHVVGPVTFYYPGAKVEISGSGACNYTVTDGSQTYKYSAMDFTSVQTVLKPGQAKEINFMFGPAIGYGSYVDFEYDSTKQYFFQIFESWGSEKIPLDLN